MENFGAVLKDIRISKNFRLKDLACNEISESTISRFENGVTKLSINHFYILLDRLGTSFSEFEELVHCYYSQKVCFWGELENAVNSSYIFTSRISPENRVKTKARKKFMQLPYKIDC